MEELKETCKNILLILDSEFPNQQHYEGVVKTIHILINDIYTLALSGKNYKEKINLNVEHATIYDSTNFVSITIISQVHN